MTNKIAVVTGAARGIGLATTKLFLNNNWSVAMIDRDEEELANAAAESGVASVWQAWADGIDDNFVSPVLDFSGTEF